MVRVKRYGVVDLTAALVQQNQQLQDTIKQLAQHELFLQQLSTALAQNNNINL
ncbi:cyclic AMP-responsive element-binding protein 3-like protein 4 isoform 1 [Corchorus olitorius]|uniref:Cyclic AMP-responsive element-binding protein 3-like protein 4 isoform 1 n=1 Tax=Corchorus olitorius TaxID=93759 RepID=A0A1R3J231_9ROSI|nr:cyclic AMP-responsive element-binding protein 3-like protein 4 isoform 1 [Corchorus olitorius]